MTHKTRREQIKDALYDLYLGHQSIGEQEGFIAGAEWADKNYDPKTLNHEAEVAFDKLESQLQIALDVLEAIAEAPGYAKNEEPYESIMARGALESINAIRGGEEKK